MGEEDRTRLVEALMAARRAIALSRKAGDPDTEARARRDVDAAKVALGERGPVWWDDGAADFNRRLVRNSPYAEWFAGLGRDSRNEPVL